MVIGSAMCSVRDQLKYSIPTTSKVVSRWHEAFHLTHHRLAGGNALAISAALPEVGECPSSSAGGFRSSATSSDLLEGQQAKPRAGAVGATG